jgi:peptidase E
LKKQILALGGGGFSQEPENLAIDRYALSLTGRDRPKVAFVPTASGDADGYVERFYTSFNTLDCEPTHLGLFRRTIPNLRDFVLSQDLIYVGGGNTLNMLALWRLHGLDAIFREAYEAGVVLAGISAGALCWCAEGTTDSLGELSRMEALGLVPHSLSVHYDAEPGRRPLFQAWVGEGKLRAGWGRGAAPGRRGAGRGGDLAAGRVGLLGRARRRRGSRAAARPSLPGRGDRHITSNRTSPLVEVPNGNRQLGC